MFQNLFSPDAAAQAPEGNSLSTWLIALAILAGGIVAARLFYFLSTKFLKPLAAKARKGLAHLLVDMLEEPFAIGMVIGALFWAERSLVLPVKVDGVFSKIVGFAVILDLTWAFARLLDSLIDSYVVPAVEKSESKLDDQVLPIVRNVSRVLIWLVGAIIAIDNAGYNVGAIVAGLGIGGLAFAFAAQETIANLFGGVTIFIDQPFRINDRIKVQGFDGWVREIGLRTSKLETLDGRRLTIPNSFFSKSVIENVSSEPATKVLETLSLARSNDAAAVERALALLAGVLKADPELKDNSTAFFGDFGASSYDLTLVLWISKGADLGQVRSRVNLAILRAFDGAGIGLALPMRVTLGEEDLKPRA
jgi:MscS family membrane protein